MAVYPIRTEFFIDGAWTSAYSDRVRADGRITIQRGQQDQQSSLSPQTSNFTLNSRDGLFSNRNPNSALYGKFGRNTQVRHSVLNAAGNYDAFFLKTYQLTGGGTWFTTADKAVLDITGDIDVRFEISPDTWRPSIPQVIGGKWNGSQRSWFVTLLPTGLLRWYWSNDGTALNSATSATGFGAATGRYALRITLDVDNGAGGRTTSFYWSTSLAGSWTLLGTNTGAGVTTIFNSTAALEVGGSNGNGSSPFANEIGFVGKVHGAEVYEGIAGTLRADFDPTVRTPGDTTWSDGLGTPNTWTLTGTNGRVTSDRIRFTGELGSIPQRWDGTGRDVYLPVTASGALRRMLQGGQPIHSAIYRNLIQYSDINGYWPMEAESDATVPDSAIAGNTSNVPDASFSGTVPDGLAGSAGRAKLNASDSRIYLASPGRASTGSASFIVYFRLESLPASDKVLMEVSGNSTVSRISIAVGAGVFTFNAYDYTGALLDNESTLFGAGVDPSLGWVGMSISLTTSGANVNWEITWHAVGTDIFYTPTPGGATFAGTVGRLGGVRLDARQDAAFVGAEFAHVLLTRGDHTVFTDEFRDSSDGFTGELAAVRMIRLAAEEGLSLDTYGNPDVTEAMGPQRPGKVLDLLQECAAVDGGVLAEARDIVGLQYVSRGALGDFNPWTLDYSLFTLAATPEPIDDDRYLLNDVTASRPGGSSARYVVEDGPLSIQDPPNGVGLYEGTVSKNVADDEDLQGQAEWETFWRTWDEARVPNIVVGLHRNPFASDPLLVNPALAAGVGSPISISNLPDFLPPNTMDLLSFGYTEVIEQFLWTLTFNTAPYGPYRTKRVDSQSGTQDIPRMAANPEFPTVLVAAENTTDTSIVIDTPTGQPKWANTTDHAAEFPFDVNLGGERITVTACTVGAVSGANWRQTLTVTRSVNGIVKSHLIGAEIDIWDLAYLQLGA